MCGIVLQCFEGQRIWSIAIILKIDISILCSIVVIADDILGFLMAIFDIFYQLGRGTGISASMSKYPILPNLFERFPILSIFAFFGTKQGGVVEVIIHDGVSQELEVDPNLMHPTGERLAQHSGTLPVVVESLEYGLAGLSLVADDADPYPVGDGFDRFVTLDHSTAPRVHTGQSGYQPPTLVTYSGKWPSTRHTYSLCIVRFRISSCNRWALALVRPITMTPDVSLSSRCITADECSIIALSSSSAASVKAYCGDP